MFKRKQTTSVKHKENITMSQCSYFVCLIIIVDGNQDIENEPLCHKHRENCVLAIVIIDDNQHDQREYAILTKHKVNEAVLAF